MHEDRSHGAHDAPASRRAAAPPVGAFGDLVAALGVVATRQTCDDASPGELLDALGAVMRMARARGLSAAQVISAAKAAWADLPDVTRRHEPDAQAAQLARLVSLCVEAYYSG